MILFSHDIFSAQRVGGVTRSMLELLRGLAGIGAPWQLWAGVHDNGLLHSFAKDDGVAGSVAAFGKALHLGRVAGSLVNEPAFARHARAAPSCVIHRTYYPVIDLVGARHAVVETLHDMWDERAETRGGAGLKSRLKKRALERADRIICVSESTRRELALLWPDLAARSTVIPHGVRRLALTPVPAGRERPFFLFVGRRDLYKNFSVAASALARSPLLADYELVCFGGDVFSEAEKQLLQELKLSGRVHQTGGGDDRLAGLYEAATALLYPSSYEGFGLPLLEAMIHGCPVIAAPLTSLPEVGGDAALYAPPEDISAWSVQMEALATSPTLAAQRRVAGIARAAGFNWEASARAHAEIYRALESADR